MKDKLFHLLYRYVGLGDSFYGYLWQIIFMSAAVIGFLVVCILLKNRFALWGLCWMGLTILITLPVEYDPSRYNYLPLIGFWITVVVVFEQLVQLLLSRFQIKRYYVFLLIGMGIGYLVLYNTIMLQWEIDDYRRLGDAHKKLVKMYENFQSQLLPNQPILFFNNGTRKPISEISASFNGYEKLLFVRTRAPWELIHFAPLANFVGEPSRQRMVPVQQSRIAEIIQKGDFQMVVFTDQDFFMSNDARHAFQQLYRAYKQLPPRAEMYHIIVFNENDEKLPNR
jgi:hypothetical protein